MSTGGLLKSAPWVPVGPKMKTLTPAWLDHAKLLSPFGEDARRKKLHAKTQIGQGGTDGKARGQNAQLPTAEKSLRLCVLVRQKRGPRGVVQLPSRMGWGDVPQRIAAQLLESVCCGCACSVRAQLLTHLGELRCRVGLTGDGGVLGPFESNVFSLGTRRYSVSLAPCNRECGKYKGKRSIQGRRAQVRKTLYSRHNRGSAQSTH